MLQAVGAANFGDEVLACPQRVLVDFFATWCGPCRMLMPVLEEIASENPDIKIVKVNVDEEADLVSNYEIRNLPTLLVFQEGKIVARNVGSATKYEVESLLHLRS